tara:strand:- start:486 stop:668 length:183 start_codon:yes stop_codon:yes gene_type:complete
MRAKNEIIKEIMSLKPLAKKAGFDFPYEHLTPAKMRPMAYTLVSEFSAELKRFIGHSNLV